MRYTPNSLCWNHYVSTRKRTLGEVSTRDGGSLDFDDRTGLVGLNFYFNTDYTLGQ